MDDAEKAFNRIKRDLERVSAELMQLIDTYDLSVETPLEIVQTARQKISDRDDYIRFLELSLQGRLLGEAAEYILHAKHDKKTMH